MNAVFSDEHATDLISEFGPVPFEEALNDKKSILNLKEISKVSTDNVPYIRTDCHPREEISKSSFKPQTTPTHVQIDLYDVPQQKRVDGVIKDQRDVFRGEESGSKLSHRIFLFGNGI